MKYCEYAECEIAPELESVRVVIEKLRAYCASQGLDPQLWSAVELAVVEAANNAVEHGCAEHPEGRVRVRWSWEDDVLEVRICDPSRFLPDTAVEATLPDDPFSESGRGAFLMQTLMDEVAHRVEADRHVLTLRKTVGAKKGAAGGMDAQAEVAMRGLVEDLGASYENLNAMFRFAEQLATSASFEEFLEGAMPRLLQLVSGSAGFLRMSSGSGSLKTVYPVPADGGQGAARIETEAAATESRVFRTGQSSTVDHCLSLPKDDPLWRDSGSAHVSPVSFQGTTLGVLSVQREGGKGSFNAAQANVIQVVAEFIGIARATATLQAQRHEQQRAIRELEIAAEIQYLLLPGTFPDLPRTRVHGVSTASREVGGDYFDVVPVENHGVLVVIADVMGKGMRAALLATIFRAALRGRSHLAALPGFLLTETNRQIRADLAKLDMFVTAQVAFFSFRHDEVCTATAGHCPIIKHSPDGALTLIEEGGVPLGVLEDEVYHTTVVPISAGDRFVFLTDGIYEVLSPQGVMLGLEGIQEQVRRLKGSDPEEHCRQLMDYVRQFSGQARQSDDRTLVIVERT